MPHNKTNNKNVYSLWQRGISLEYKWEKKGIVFHNFMIDGNNMKTKQCNIHIHTLTDK